MKKEANDIRDSLLRLSNVTTPVESACLSQIRINNSIQFLNLNKGKQLTCFNFIFRNRKDKTSSRSSVANQLSS